jgi:HSP20 family molecular chaperone IbpA
MGTIFLEKHFSPLDILVKNFFQEEEQFQQPTNRILNHPVDIYEDKEGLYFDIACTGLTKKQIELKVEDDVLRVSYTKKDKDEEKDLHSYHSGIAKRNFNLGWKIARRFVLSDIEASMKDGLLKLFIPLQPESKPKKVSIK